MTVQEARLKLAVRIADRASASASSATMDDRLSTFREAYDALASMEYGGPDWTEDALNAAWSIVDDAFPRGAERAVLLEAMAASFATVVTTAAAPPPTQPQRPRRDA